MTWPTASLDAAQHPSDKQTVGFPRTSLITAGFVGDMGLQNPVTDPAADQPDLWALPSCGPVRVATAAGVTAEYPVARLLLGPAWAVAASTAGLLVEGRTPDCWSTAGLLVFAARTWSYVPSRAGPARVPRQRAGRPQASADSP